MYVPIRSCFCLLFTCAPLWFLPPADKTYMVGDSLLPADVSTSNGQDPNENTTHVNIPSGTWYSFNTTKAIQVRFFLGDAITQNSEIDVLLQQQFTQTQRCNGAIVLTLVCLFFNRDHKVT